MSSNQTAGRYARKRVATGGLALGGRTRARHEYSAARAGSAREVGGGGRSRARLAHEGHREVVRTRVRGGTVSKRTRKRRMRKKNAANHGTKPHS
ncbi:hypothetical protein F8178_03720 [Haloechinothrix sp. LS1_15]|nr:hypothetical protein [Haloechinothrix sp. LS1_15]